MIARVKDDQYLNMFEVASLFIAAEFIITMNFLKLYDIDSDTWYKRRIAWAIVGLAFTAVILAGFASGTVAAVKYLL